MVRTMTRYECEICFEEYETLEEAKECESRGQPTPRYKVGDKVLMVDKKTGTIENMGIHHSIRYGIRRNDIKAVFGYYENHIIGLQEGN